MALRLGLGLGLANIGGGFSPLSLSPEAFYDPSDTSTLFQDAAGTTPVTTAGDPVWLMLGKSQGLARGPELVANGGFDANLSSWTDRSSGTGSATWTASGVEIIRVDLANTGHITQDIAVTEGEWYQFTFTGVSGGGAAFRLGSTTASNQLYDSIIPIGPSNVIVRATTSLISIGLRGAINSSTTVIDDVSMRHLPGNHLTATSDAARPTLQANGTLSDDGIDDALIAPITGTYSAYIAAGASLISDESVVMADDYDVLRDDFIGAIIVSGTLTADQKTQLANYWGVTVA